MHVILHLIPKANTVWSSMLSKYTSERSISRQQIILNHLSKRVCIYGAILYSIFQSNHFHAPAASLFAFLKAVPVLLPLDRMVF